MVVEVLNIRYLNVGRRFADIQPNVKSYHVLTSHKSEELLRQGLSKFFDSELSNG